MKRELGIGRCGLACCLCSENVTCSGCNAGSCKNKEWCENRKCSLGKKLDGCFSCAEKDCRKGVHGKIKPYAFSLFIQRYGIGPLLDCLERNEKNGVVYHRNGIVGDYDDFTDVEALIAFIKDGPQKRKPPTS
jgi:hypothetical protein